MDRPHLTHCPHCGKSLWDERLDEQGLPKLDTIWELPADDNGPGQRLRITEVEPNNRYNRDIRGYLSYKTKKSGSEYAIEDEEFYSTSIDIFHKVWVRDPNAPKDTSLFHRHVG